MHTTTRSRHPGWPNTHRLLLVVAAYALLLIPLFSPPSAFSKNITVARIRCKQSQTDASHPYFVSLLQLALEKTLVEYGPAKIEIMQFNPSQGRALEELLDDDTINVDWAGTSIMREESLRPIRIPLIGGLLGYRIPLIRKDSRQSFSRIKTLQDLRSVLVIQGAHWPDSDILEAAGLQVYRVPTFQLMFNMLQEGRVDCFLRGVNEIYAEYAALGNNRLTIFDSLIVHYPLPMYFFTSRKNEALAGRIEKGLLMAIDDGSFLQHMKRHPVTAPLFPLSRYDHAVMISIENPGLPKDTPLDDKSLWLTIGNATKRQ